MIKISAVSYLNTLPFIYGLTQSSIIKQIDLSIDYPAECANKLINKEVDIGLIPVATLPLIADYNIISDYCIGANGRVNSVFLFSNVEITKVKRVFLDYQSKTSINLMKILARKYWKIKPEWVSARVGYENKLSGNSAGVIIGDRTFKLKHKFEYSYDLAEEWKKMTKLPFVFACWTANKKIDKQFINQFNKAIELGINNIDGVLQFYEKKIDRFSKYANIKEYLNRDISYNFSRKKHEALELFLNEMKNNNL